MHSHPLFHHHYQRRWITATAAATSSECSPRSPGRAAPAGRRPAGSGAACGGSRASTRREPSPPYSAGRPYMAGLSWGGIVLAQQCFANYTARMRMSSQDLAVVTDSPRRLTWLGILLSDNLRIGGCIISAARARHHRQTLASAFSHGPIPSTYSAPCRTGLSLSTEGERELQRERERERERERDRAGVLQDRTRMQFGKCYCEDAAASALSRPPLTSTPPPLLFSPRLQVKRTVYA